MVIPPISDKINVTLRRYVVRRDTFQDLIDWGSVTPAVAGLLTACTYVPTGIIICGQPGAGKTTLANALLDSAPATTRVIACEDTPELRVAHLNGVSWRTRPAGPDGSGEVLLRDLVKMALGMRPDIIAVGETRGGEAYELTRAGNAGCGWMSTIHANSGRAAMQALISTAVMAGNNVPSQEVRAVFSSIVDLVVFLDREPVQLRDDGTSTRRQVMEVLAVPPMQGSDTDVTVEPLFIREEFGAPLKWTGAPPPPELERRLEQRLPWSGHHAPPRARRQGGHQMSLLAALAGAALMVMLVAWLLGLDFVGRKIRSEPEDEVEVAFQRVEKAQAPKRFTPSTVAAAIALFFAAAIPLAILTSSVILGFVLGLLAGSAPLIIESRKKAKEVAERNAAWPDAIRQLISSLRAPMSVHASCSISACRVPSP